MKNPDWNKKNEGERPDGGILKPGERIDELQRNNYRIIQDPGRFCFGMDAVLLSGFVRVKEGERVLDLGTGTGIIPILLEAKTRASHLTGLEIQPDSADMAKRSVALNGLSDKIDIVQGDIREAAGIFPAASFDVITCNPPYITDGHGLTNPEAPMAIARHEVKCTFADVDTTGPNSFTMDNATLQSGILIPISSVDALRIFGTTGFFGSINVSGPGINSLTSFIALSSTYATSSIMAMS